MISRLGLRLSDVFRKTAPDPFVLAIVLSIVTLVLALLLGFPTRTGPRPALADRAVSLLDSWRAGDGLWKFLAFGMQMCLILVTGHALASSGPVRRGLDRLARLPRSTATGAAMIGLVACLAALVNWGLGLIVGALLARDVGRSLHARGIRAHYPLLCAAGYMGLLVWHGGLSGSAPLSVTTPEGAATVLPDDALAQLGRSGIGLGGTIFSPMNLFISLGLLVIVPIVLALLAPKGTERVTGIEAFRISAPPQTERVDAQGRSTIPDRLENSPVLAWVLAIPLLLGLVRSAQTTGLGRIGLNEVNATMLALGLILHASPRSYLRAVEEAARGCAGIILQFPIYAGIMAMLVASGLVAMFAGSLAGVGGEAGTPLLTFLSAGVVNLFVPSGGGQWGIQGPIALRAGLDAGIAPGKMVMAVAYGDELTNMLQPFWALPLLAITGVRARDIVGYTAIVMVVAGVWMAIGLVVF